jgi:hypothetical protein
VNQRVVEKEARQMAAVVEITKMRRSMRTVVVVATVLMMTSSTTMHSRHLHSRSA